MSEDNYIKINNMKDEDVMNKINKIKEDDEEGERISNTIIGNCYQYREKYSDKYFNYIRVITTDKEKLAYLIIDKFSKTDNSWRNVEFVRTVESLTNIQNMTQIPLTEFEYQVSEYLKIMNIGFLPGTLS